MPGQILGIEWLIKYTTASFISQKGKVMDGKSLASLWGRSNGGGEMKHGSFPLSLAPLLFLFFNVTTAPTGPHNALHPGCGVPVVNRVNRQRVLEQYPWIYPCTCLVIFVLTSGRATETWWQDNEVFLSTLTLRNWRHLCNLIQSHRLCMLWLLSRGFV